MVRKKPDGLEATAYFSARSLIRSLRRKRKDPAPRTKRLRLAFIHNERRAHGGIQTGAAQINKLMASALKRRGVLIRHFYPRTQLTDAPVHLKGLSNILFFYSLLERKEDILKCDLIQGTTYTPLPFLSFSVPVICHFGSTAVGYLSSVPRSSELPDHEREVYKTLARAHAIPEFDAQTIRPIEDIADIETLVAQRARMCVATSEKVREELIAMGVAPERICVIYNAIEDYWFDPPRPTEHKEPHLVFLGRLGADAYTLKLKGFARLMNFFEAFPEVPKTTVYMTPSRKLKEWMRDAFPNHTMYVNLRKDLIPQALAPLYGSICIIPSRYEGFSLSLVEAMSQGLVPISFRVGVAPEIIRDGENGYLVSSTEEAIVRAKELLTDSETRLRLAAAAQETARAFTTDRIAEQLHALYEDIQHVDA